MILQQMRLCATRTVEKRNPLYEAYVGRVVNGERRICGIPSHRGQ